ncbi:glycine cleavage system protein H [Gorillibacterium timonense]|uniref:glycine cleavage system protein H n=1 Tax=Gorillibacterium timonense TaxID=1689269 RepID=UPI00071C792C|nr:glycine cleavage system protein H [Gorillibacterium timonense]
MTIEERKYSEGHLWVMIEGRTAKLGLTDYLQHELGMLVFAELPRTGERLVAGEPFGSVESVKSVSELDSPVSGKIVAVNPAVAENPALVNLDPNQAWLVQVELEAPEETEALWEEERYKALFPDQDELPDPEE